MSMLQKVQAHTSWHVGLPCAPDCLLSPSSSSSTLTLLQDQLKGHLFLEASRILQPV